MSSIEETIIALKEKNYDFYINLKEWEMHLREINE